MMVGLLWVRVRVGSTGGVSGGGSGGGSGGRSGGGWVWW